MQARNHVAALAGTASQFFCGHANFVVPRKFYNSYQLHKNLDALKCIFLPQTLKPGYGPGCTSAGRFDSYVHITLRLVFTESCKVQLLVCFDFPKNKLNFRQRI